MAVRARTKLERSTRSQVRQDRADASIVRRRRGKAQLADDVTDVSLDRVRCDKQPLGNATVGEALGHQREDFALAPRELIEWVVGPAAIEE